MRILFHQDLMETTIWKVTHLGKTSPKDSGTYFEGTEPYKAVWRVEIPLHRPYPYCLGEDSSILGTWNVWWKHAINEKRAPSCLGIIPGLS